MSDAEAAAPRGEGLGLRDSVGAYVCFERAMTGGECGSMMRQLEVAAAEPLHLGLLQSPAAPRRRLSRMEVDGFLTGVAVAPVPVEEHRWLAELCGAEMPNIDDPALRQAARVLVGAVKRTKEMLDRAGLDFLKTGRLDYQPACLAGQGAISGPAVPPAILEWMGGFWDAGALCLLEWEARARNELARRMMFPLLALSGPLLTPGNMGALEDEDRAAAMDDLPKCLVAMRALAGTGAGPTEPFRRIKIGRNDVCPCGSGGKYKKCCGARED